MKNAVKILLTLTMMFGVLPAMADKYNFDFCKGCDSGDISDYFNRYAGKSPVYRGDMEKGKVTGYERYVINEPGYPNWYGVRTIPVPQELQQRFEEIADEYNKVNHYLGTGYEYDENGNLTGHNPLPYVKKNTDKLTNLFKDGKQDGVWVDPEIATSPWQLVGQSFIRNDVIDYGTQVGREDSLVYVTAYLAKFTQFITLGLVDIKTVNPVITLQFGKWNSSTGLYEYEGEIRLEIAVADIDDNFKGTLDWSSAKDVENNNVPENGDNFKASSPHRITPNNFGPFLGALQMIDRHREWVELNNLMNELPVTTSCFVPGSTFCYILPF